AFAATAANARLLADVLALLGVIQPSQDAEVLARRARICGVALPLYGTVLYLLWPAPLSLILISGVGQALLLPFLAGCALYLRHRKLTPELRPGPLWTAGLWLSGVALAGVGAWNIVSRF